MRRSRAAKTKQMSEGGGELALEAIMANSSSLIPDEGAPWQMIE